ncbi:MAG: hypothetical protein Q8P05_00685 [Candidatus Diapherotrites archaeon]|nr:hypothetical protein [Candidatus Diapherotrites archaeon]
MNCYGSCGPGYSRGFLTREEKIELLSEYQAQLEKEAQGVKEKISQLQNAS